MQLLSMTILQFMHIIEIYYEIYAYLYLAYKIKTSQELMKELKL